VLVVFITDIYAEMPLGFLKNVTAPRGPNLDENTNGSE
jgi:hypothetical protein